MTEVASWAGNALKEESCFIEQQLGLQGPEEGKKNSTWRNILFSDVGQRQTDKDSSEVNGSEDRGGTLSTGIFCSVLKGSADSLAEKEGQDEKVAWGFEGGIQEGLPTGKCRKTVGNLEAPDWLAGQPSRVTFQSCPSIACHCCQQMASSRAAAWLVHKEHPQHRGSLSQRD